MLRKKINRVIKFLIALYILSFSFLQIFDFPIVGTKVQPPEIVFLLLFSFVSISAFNRINKQGLGKSLNHIAQKIGQTDWKDILAICIYSLTVLTSTIYHNELKSWFEFLGLIYLILVFFIIRFYLSELTTSRVVKYVILSGLLASILGILGWSLAQFGIETPLALSKASYYPYMGYSGRAKAFTMNPNMLMSIVVVSFLFKFSAFIFTEKPKLYDWLVLLTLGVGGILTFSKDLVILTICTIFILYLSKNKILFNPFVKTSKYLSKTSFNVVSIGLLLVYLVGSHLTVFNKETINWEILKKKAFTLDSPILETQNHYFVLTNYVVNKKSGTLAGIRNPLFGVGPGGHNEFVSELKKEGKYPEYFTNYDPHCTYTGAFGELGILGLIALLYLGFSILKKINGLLKIENHPQKIFVIGLASCFLYFSMEAITTDIMNFRHFWVLMGILFSLEMTNLKSSLSHPLPPIRFHFI